MFGWFKPKPAPEGPLTVDFDIAIERSAQDVFALIDFADARNAKRQVGKVEQVDERHFTMVLDMLPDMRFDMTVTERSVPFTYAFATEITPRPGRLVHNTERYEIEPTGDSSCVLRLVTRATFEDGLTMRQFEQEVVRMSQAVNNALAKLKIHAEHGVEAIRQIERLQVAA